jgi:hypothetical protein
LTKAQPFQQTNPDYTRITPCNVPGETDKHQIRLTPAPPPNKWQDPIMMRARPHLSVRQKVAERDTK